ncbi:DNA processing protein [Caloramator fervidus]|uniref:DNA processing protein n=1 Tax=Caloramator fervidus TaxID=29344 RepID=A0A1H5XBQ9_9CLOT|nr:DNA-processing protein DprA [Caloramator fervidus]SEG09172.1 DNA processing protein [Caloramator fervidus]
MEQELYYKIWFIGVNVNEKIKISILDKGYDICSIYHMDEFDLINLGMNIYEAKKFVELKKDDKIYKIIDFIKDNDIKLVLYNELEYPNKLKYIHDPPVGLFIKGNLVDFEKSIAIVGSRKASNYGLTVAYKFSKDLSNYGVKIISGLAKGIDTAAHLGCLDAGGITVGILGSGFKHIYPSSNKELIDRIIKEGCIITEFLPDVKPFPQNFPRRNRIISGLADYVLVVEATERSGSLITARLALEQGKDVFAIPGNIFSQTSVGTNNLIKDGAKLISNIEDILVEFGISLKDKDFIGYNELELYIINILRVGAATVEEIVEKSNMSTSEVLSVLGKLECKGVIKRGFGNYVMLNDN